MTSLGIPKTTLQFLTELNLNNNRPWFNDHKAWYEEEHTGMVAFAEALMAEMNKVDVLEPMSGKQSLFRIYRDVRFSKDKSPYKKAFSGRMRRATKMRRGGMYYHIEPGNCLLAGGFWNPNSGDLSRIRQELSADPDTLRGLMDEDMVQEYFGGLEGEQLKTSPRGYDNDHPAIDLLRYKQFLLVRRFSDAQVKRKDFLEEAVKTFVAMRPFFDYMSDVLTTDANGALIV